MNIETRKITATKQERRTTKRTVTVSWSSVPQPVNEYRIVEMEGEVTLTIDVESLLKALGPKALTSKTRKSVEASGAVVVTARVTSAKTGDWVEFDEYQTHQKTLNGISI